MNGNAAGNTTAPIRGVEVSPTDAALSEIANEQHATFELLDRLQVRLEKVLGPEPPCGKEDGALQDRSTPLLAAIDGRNESAKAINNRLRWIMDRIVL